MRRCSLAHAPLHEHFWSEIAPLLPPPRPHPKGSRRLIENRLVLIDILFVLRSGLPWEMLPADMGFDSGMTCWCRLRDGQAAGIWTRLHQVLLGRLHEAGELDWSQASLDSVSVAAQKRGSATGLNLTDRGKPGTKRHRVVEARGTPLGLTLAGADRNDSVMMAQNFDAIPPVRSGRRGRPRGRPHKLHADKAYDARARRQECRARGSYPATLGAASTAARRSGVTAGSSSAPPPGSTDPAPARPLRAPRRTVGPRSDIYEAFTRPCRKPHHP